MFGIGLKKRIEILEQENAKLTRKNNMNGDEICALLNRIRALEEIHKAEVKCDQYFTYLGMKNTKEGTGHDAAKITLNVESIPDLTLEEFARMMIDNQPVERKEDKKVLYVRSQGV